MSFVEKTRFRELWDGLLAEGTTMVGIDELVERSGATKGGTWNAVAAATKRRLVFSPVRGLYVLVPPQYRSWGVVPADWFIADLCAHLGRSYYVGYLSAAAYHGASHQAPQVFQAVVDRKIAAREVEGLRLRFYQTSHFGDRATTTATGPNGPLVVATPETCALDLAEHSERGGGLGNVATILSELKLDPEALVIGATGRRPATIRRLGYLLELVSALGPWEHLRALARTDAGAPTLLHPKGGFRGPVDARWNIQANTPVEPDE